jgi:hypothetical protein
MSRIPQSPSTAPRISHYNGDFGQLSDYFNPPAGKLFGEADSSGPNQEPSRHPVIPAADALPSPTKE